MQVLHVKKYNRQAEIAWHNACEHHEIKTQADIYTQPFIGTYLFYTNNGEERKTGYVAFGDHGAYWFKTKREAMYKALE